MIKALLGISIVGLLASLVTFNSDPQALKIIHLHGPNDEDVTLLVEVADEPKEQKQGLMGRTELVDIDGMLFIFDHSMPLSFWMKNTLIPLDVIFFDNELNYVSHSGMKPCKIDPCPHFWSADLAQYALEVAGGFVNAQGVGAGWRLELDVMD